MHPGGTNPTSTDPETGTRAHTAFPRQGTAPDEVLAELASMKSGTSPGTTARC